MGNKLNRKFFNNNSSIIPINEKKLKGEYKYYNEENAYKYKVQKRERREEKTFNQLLIYF